MGKTPQERLAVQALLDKLREAPILYLTDIYICKRDEFWGIYTIEDEIIFRSTSIQEVVKMTVSIETPAGILATLGL